ncbi:LapA family protein [Rhodovarius lipocyclicus]|uniref:LapA family protein n=1 Tax=Rhodovarius lipocyclicus TaxID=268410 RepID=UPI0013596E56|nr:LapA family protein [Rhodovarius lipocyclicus]
MRWLLLLPFLLLLALFAASNREDVALRLWPLDASLALPLWLAVLGTAGLFLILGSVLGWAAAVPARRRLRELQRAANIMEGELVALRREQEAAPEGSPQASKLPQLAG